MSNENSGFDHKRIDSHWQSYWRDNQTFLTSTDRTKPKYYVLDMFPYPSGNGLHVGHPKGYVATDVVARAKRMLGFNVLRVMGWDSFGLPAERQAERENKHPAEITKRNVKTFKGQLEQLGLSYDWSREIATSDASYYKWTQWLFLKLYQKGLAYQADVPVNWCPALGTVLANEEVSDGKYIETGDPVERRNMKQWMLRITDYADELLDGLEGLDWPQGTINQQRNWIGRSVGAEISFAVQGLEESITVFTTRPDTLFGCSYVVLAPEHPLVAKITTAENKAAVSAYQKAAAGRSERDRISDSADAEKTGANTGAFAKHPVTAELVPIWIADYVLASYGTGAVFACPAHDVRDYAFAKKYELPVTEVVSGGDIASEAYTGDGAHINSQFLDGKNIEEAKNEMIAWLEKNNAGKQSISYRLRDWLFSRQRYWGEPFPMVEKSNGVMEPVDEASLPVLLPELSAYKPTEDGRPPLARASEWCKTTDSTGNAATRETNTMPQWAGSCWYYFRFISPKFEDGPWDPEADDYWMPVDLYVGGNEHATLHLLYARFWHRVFHELGLTKHPEPFKRLFHQGMIHAQSYRDEAGKYYYVEQVEKSGDGFVTKEGGKPIKTRLEKMSKSRYNVVNPDDMCASYGADSLRLYELFMGPLEDGCEWETSGVAGTRRFLDRAWRLLMSGEEVSDKVTDEVVENKPVERALHEAIRHVTDAIDSLRFNTAISSMMVFVNEATKAKKVSRVWLKDFVRILAPFAPHLAEEMWKRLGSETSLTFEPWPKFDENKLKLDTITLAVQVCGKMRGKIEVPAGVTKEEALELAKQESNIAKHLEGKTLKREIYVPNRLINFVAVD